MREHEFETAGPRGRRKRRSFDDDDPQFLKRARYSTPRAFDTKADTDTLESGDVWSSWDGALHGPEPRPDWVITDRGGDPSSASSRPARKPTSTGCAGPSRAPDGRCCSRPSATATGAPAVPPRRRVPRGPAGPPVPRAPGHGHPHQLRAAAIAGQWAAAEFDALGRLWAVGQQTGAVTVRPPSSCAAPSCCWSSSATPTRASPRRGCPAAPGRRRASPALGAAARRPDGAGTGWAGPGDLSPFNLLSTSTACHSTSEGGRGGVQPEGPALLAHDVKVMTNWFAARGLVHDPMDLTDDLLREANMA